MDSQFLGVPDMDALIFFSLALASFCTALFGMITGAGGGPILLALMAMVLPPAILIPVHTVVQLGVGSSRVLLLRNFILWPTMLPFIAGSIVGAAAGAPIFVSLPGAALQAIVALFILLVAWMPSVGRVGPEKGRFALLGLVATFLGMFVSSTGSFLAPFVASISPERRHYAATTSILMAMTHIIKLVTFALMGFGIGVYLPLMGAMVTTAALGNWVGRRILVRMPEAVFRVVLKTLLTVLAARLLWVAARDGGVF
jgi:uncharacterized membrane protein YfcA